MRDGAVAGLAQAVNNEIDEQTELWDELGPKDPTPPWAGCARAGLDWGGARARPRGSPMQ